MSCQSKFTVNDQTSGDPCKENPKLAECDAKEDGEASGKLAIADCVDPDLNDLIKGKKITLCDGTEAEGKFDLSNLVAANLKSGITIGGITGTLIGSGLSDCATDGETNCKAVGGYPAAKVDAANLHEGNIKRGVTIGGVTGKFPSSSYALARYSSNNGTSTATVADGGITTDLTLFSTQLTTNGSFEFWDSEGVRYTGSGDGDIVAANVKSGIDFENFTVSGTAVVPDPWDVRVGSNVGTTTGKLKTNCRNASNSAVHDMEFPGLIATADNTTERLTSAGHGLASNDRVRLLYSSMPTGLSNSTTYYVRLVDANTIELSASSGPGAAVTFTGDGANVTIHRWNDGTLSLWDTIDDYNNGGAYPSDYPAAWNADTYCGGVEIVAGDANVWKDVTSTICDGAGDECRYKDKISNLEWSESDGVTRSWGAAVQYCEDLVLDGQSDWRLPTQKELRDAYSHGIRSAANAHWITDAQITGNYFWSSSSSSASSANAWYVFFTAGNSAGLSKTGANLAACVR